MWKSLQKEGKKQESGGYRVVFVEGIELENGFFRNGEETSAYLSTTKESNNLFSGLPFEVNWKLTGSINQLVFEYSI